VYTQSFKVLELGSKTKIFDWLFCNVSCNEAITLMTEVSLKRPSTFTRLHWTISQKAVIFILVATRTWNLTLFLLCFTMINKLLRHKTSCCLLVVTYNSLVLQIPVGALIFYLLCVAYISCFIIDVISHVVLYATFSYILKKVLNLPLTC
jgi:hypothetical protein